MSVWCRATLLSLGRTRRCQVVCAGCYLLRCFVVQARALHGPRAIAPLHAPPYFATPARSRSPAPQVKEVHEEEWSYIPVGGPLPRPDQPITAFGAAANLVHPATGGGSWGGAGCWAGWLNASHASCPSADPLLPATASPASSNCAVFFGGRLSHCLPHDLRTCMPSAGYSLTRSLREAPSMARAIRAALEEQSSHADAARFVWEALWTQEKRRQVGRCAAVAERSAVEKVLCIHTLNPRRPACQPPLTFTSAAPHASLGNKGTYRNTRPPKMQICTPTPRRHPSTCLAWSCWRGWT